MLHPWETVRIFLSSTFADFHAERDYLVKRVIPEVRLWCQRYRLHVADIDLRWGVTEQEVESEALLGLCLENIEASMPFFVCMLGERYGMVLPRIPSRIRCPAAVAGRSITHIEAAHALWLAREPMRALFLERESGCLPAPEDVPQFDRDERIAYGETFFPVEDAAPQAALKAEIRARLQRSGREDCYLTYRCRLDPGLSNPEAPGLRGRIAPDSLRDFGDAVRDRLIAGLSQEYAERIAAIEASGGDVPEAEYHESFAHQHMRAYIARPAYTVRLFDYARGEERTPLLLFGPSGYGKSSMLSHFYLSIRDCPPEGTDIVLAHFAGASQRATGARQLLAYLIGEIQAHYDIQREIPSGLDALSSRFAELLADASVRALLIVDGADQLDSPHDDPLWWLPAQLGENVRLIVGIMTDVPPQGREACSLPLEALDGEEIVRVIRHLPTAFAKSLGDASIDILREKEDASNPLYLKVALEELRVFGSHAGLNQEIRDLPGRLQDVIIHTIDRLAREHGEVFAEAFFSLLYCARQGLEEGEFAALFAENLARLTGMGAQEARDGFYLVFRQMREFLHHRGTAIDFCHAAIVSAVRERFSLGEEGRRTIWHRLLMEHFGGQDVFFGGDREKPNPRRAFEYAYQCAMAGQAERFADAVTSYDWIEAKIACFGAYAAVEDCALLPPEQTPPSARMVHRLLDLSWHILARESIPVNKAQGQMTVASDDPKYNERYIGLASQAVSEAQQREQAFAAYARENPREDEILRGSRQLAEQLWARGCGISDPRIVRLLEDARAARRGAWFRAAFPCLPSPEEPLLFTLDTQPPFAPVSICMTPDGRYCSASSVGWVKIYDLERRICLHTLRQDAVTATATIDAEAKYALVTDLNNEVWLWDVQAETVLRKRSVPCFYVGEIAPNGRFALMGKDEPPHEIWDMQTLETVCPFTNEGVQRTLSSMMMTAPYKVFSDFRDTIDHYARRTYNRRLERDVTAFPDKEDAKKLHIHITGREAWQERQLLIEAHTAQILLAVTSPGASVVATTSNDRTVGLWGLPKGESVARLTNMTGNPLMAQMDREGKRLVVAVNDCSLNVYDIEGIGERSTLSDHHWTVAHSAFVSEDGERAFTLANDHMCKVWDIRTGECLNSWRHDTLLREGECAQGGWLASGISGMLQFLHMETGERKTAIVRPPQGKKNEEGKEKMLRGIGMLTADEKSLIGVDEDGSLLRLAAPTGEILAEYPIGCGGAQAARICEEAGLAATARRSPFSCSLWDLAECRLIRNVETQIDAQAVAFAPGLGAIYAGGQTVYETDPRTGDVTPYLGMHLMPILSIAASPDGRWVATASYDKTLRLWSTRTKRCEAVFGGHVSMIAAVFTPDSRMLIAGDESGRVSFFHIEEGR